MSRVGRAVSSAGSCVRPVILAIFHCVRRSTAPQRVIGAYRNLWRSSLLRLRLLAESSAFLYWMRGGGCLSTLRYAGAFNPRIGLRAWIDPLLLGDRFGGRAEVTSLSFAGSPTPRFAASQASPACRASDAMPLTAILRGVFAVGVGVAAVAATFTGHIVALGLVIRGVSGGSLMRPETIG